MAILLIDMDISLLFSARLWFFVLMFAVSSVILLTVVWFERKAAARVQMRVGPYHVSPLLGGYLQLLADAFKFIISEPIVPRGAHKVLFVWGPPIFVTLAFGASLLLPLTPELRLIKDAGLLPYGFVFSLVILLLVSIIIVIIGWSVNNKFAYIGAAREALLVAAYEIPLIVSVLAMVILYGTLNPLEIVNKQTVLTGAVLNPIAFLVFIIATAMATARFPFEIADYEGDVATGPYSDYGGIFLVLSFAGGTYYATFSYSYLATLLFLGGWALPGFSPGPWPQDIIGHLMLAVWVFVKTSVLMFFFAFLRAVMPVLRLDQTLALGWRGLLLLGVVAVAWSTALRLLGVSP
ncbi:NADH-ubiquinone oxidoreductase subunit [Pyrobaculum aerophilum str. IM2]|uniref:NADH-ubiquinone oxidoreductase subunit n=3 Tax=Pyrobaculum aerophilum TaxID=13773 RepID=Q8ZWX0_PYRAE|nr:NADH-ubiquinone oxidoreductase subunit [Pyrobaculum aerophilum str. IM2]HII46457.1 NADH-quinone oxidoreductase subunit NuoH [Pyrobaculum aerophilum]